MVQNINGSADKFLADLERIQATSERAQRELSSGLKVERPSDAPDQIREIVRLRAEIQRNAQIQSNLTSAKPEVDAADGALQSAIRVIDSALQIGAQGAGDLHGTVERESLAKQAEALLEQLVGLSRTSVAGRFVFSGDQPDEPAYELNLDNANGVNRLLTAPATRQLQDVSGMSFGVARTAQDVFDHRNTDDTPAQDNAFAAINSLRVALEGDDDDAIRAAIDQLHKAGEYLNSQLGFYGAAQNRIQEALDRVAKFQVQEQQDLSTREDADIAAAAVELQQSQNQLNAALSARAKLPKTSLFDYIA